MFQSIAHRYSRSPAIEPLAKKRGEILLTTNNPPHGQITTDVHIGSPQKTKIPAPWYDFKSKYQSPHTFVFLTKDNFRNDYALVFFYLFKNGILRVSLIIIIKKKGRTRARRVGLMRV